MLKEVLGFLFKPTKNINLLKERTIKEKMLLIWIITLIFAIVNLINEVLAYNAIKDFIEFSIIEIIIEWIKWIIYGVVILFWTWFIYTLLWKIVGLKHKFIDVVIVFILSEILYIFTLIITVISTLLTNYSLILAWSVFLWWMWLFWIIFLIWWIILLSKWLSVIWESSEWKVILPFLLTCAILYFLFISISWMMVNDEDRMKSEMEAFQSLESIIENIPSENSDDITSWKWILSTIKDETKKAADTGRILDIKNIEMAFYMYEMDYYQYPESKWECLTESKWIWSKLNGAYMNWIPKGLPKADWTLCKQHDWDYFYKSLEKNQTLNKAYIICANVESYENVNAIGKKTGVNLELVNVFDHSISTYEEMSLVVNDSYSKIAEENNVWLWEMLHCKIN